MSVTLHPLGDGSYAIHRRGRDTGARVVHRWYGYDIGVPDGDQFRTVTSPWLAASSCTAWLESADGQAWLDQLPREAS